MLTIKMTPQELRDAVVVIGQKRDAIVAAVEELKSKVNEVTSNWEGAAQSQFVDTFTTTFLPMLEKDFPEIIAGINEQLSAAAQSIEEADAQIASSFKL